MIKRTLFSVAILLFTTNICAANSISDTSYTDGLTAFDWSPISDVEKVLQYENQKDISKRTIDNVKKAKTHYVDAYKLMINKEYNAAITEFKAAMKIYKRAKLSNNALNFINANMALSYASTGNEEDLAFSKRFLELITAKVYTDNKWTYNIAIVHNKVGNVNEAASLLSSIIRKDKFDFQAYKTLEVIYRNSGNEKDADKVVERMEAAEEKLIQKNQKTSTAGKKTKENKKKKEGYIPKGKRPDVTNLKIVQKDDPLQFNNNIIDERSMIQIQKGKKEYNLGAEALNNKDYTTAQTHLKNAEKQLKRGKITEDGLIFVRGNLAILYLAKGERSGVGQAKRYLKSLTAKIYETREWTYNMAVAHYVFADVTKSKTIKEEYKTKAIKLFKASIKLDKLFLPAYENLIYVYRELNDEKKALKIYNSYEKSRDELMKSFSKEKQIAQGGDPYIFRVNLGAFGEFDTPADLFEEDHLITIPEDDQKTTYLAGMFYTLDEAEAYQKLMTEEGYTTSFIVAFKDGERKEF